MDEEADELTVATDQGIELYSRAEGRRRRYYKKEGEQREAIAGKPVTVQEDGDKFLKVVDTGPPLWEEAEEVEDTFHQHLRSYGGSGFGTTYTHLTASSGSQWRCHEEH